MDQVGEEKDCSQHQVAWRNPKTLTGSKQPFSLASIDDASRSGRGPPYLLAIVHRPFATIVAW